MCEAKTALNDRQNASSTQVLAVGPHEQFELVKSGYPYDAAAVPMAMATTAPMSRQAGTSRPATNSASMVTMGVNACEQ